MGTRPAKTRERRDASQGTSPPHRHRPQSGRFSGSSAQFDRADAAAKPVAGRVTARRLNRAEYNNTVRDLLAIDFRPADDFPQDDSGYGFDTIGDALSLSPVLMEKYFAAAEKIARTAIFGTRETRPYRRPPPAALSRRHRWRR